jgi:predicted transcriptional regulator YheO
MRDKSGETPSDQAEMLGQQLKAAVAGMPPSADDCLNTLRFLLDTMSTAFGDRVEVVLHDFRQPERSIVAIAGGVTGRKAGGSVTQIGLSIIRAGEDAKDQYSYVTRAPNGRVLKSVTVPLRDQQRHVFGALCVNIDITEMWMMGQSIQNLIGTDEQAEPHPVTFVDDIDGVISDVLKEETRMLGRPLDELSREERLRLLKALDFRGVFSLQRSIPQVADHLGLSRATLYNDLKRMRRAESPDADADDERARPVRTSPPTSILDTETTHDEF